MPHERRDPRSAAVGQADLDRPRLLGLRNLIRKDLAEWIHGKRPWIVLGVTTTVFALAAANAWITDWAVRSFPAEPGDEPAKVLSMQPLDNVLFAIGTQFIVLAVDLRDDEPAHRRARQRDAGLDDLEAGVADERARQQVADRHARPVGRRGRHPVGRDDGHRDRALRAPRPRDVLALGVTLITVPAFFVAVALAAATFVPSQAAVGAIGMAVLAAPLIVGGVVPALAPFFPGSIFDWAVAISTGGPASPVTPVAWLVGLAVLFGLARRRLNAMDL